MSRRIIIDEVRKKTLIEQQLKKENKALTARGLIAFVTGLLVYSSASVTPIAAADELPQVSAKEEKNLTFTGGMRIQTRYTLQGGRT